jgi:hypothetical protein
MNASVNRRLAIVLVCVLLVTTTKPAMADDQIVSNTDVALIVAAIVAIGAGIGIGIYILARKAPSLTGCATSSADGLQLLNEGDSQTYMLTGAVSGIKSNDRVRVKGKKLKRASNHRQFLVEKVAKDFGVCKVQPATP